MQISIKFLQFCIIVFDRSDQTCPKYLMVVPLVIVLQYIKKTLSQVHLCSIVMQKVRYFMGIWSRCYLFFLHLCTRTCRISFFCFRVLMICFTIFYYRIGLFFIGSFQFLTFRGTTNRIVYIWGRRPYRGIDAKFHHIFSDDFRGEVKLISLLKFA